MRIIAEPSYSEAEPSFNLDIVDILVREIVPVFGVPEVSSLTFVTPDDGCVQGTGD